MCHVAATVIMVSEFRSATYRQPCSAHQGDTTLLFCQNFPGDSVGVAYLRQYAFLTHPSVLFLGPLIILAWVCAWNAASWLVLQPRFFKLVAPTPVLKVPKAGGGEQVVVDVDRHALLSQSCVLSWHSLSLALHPPPGQGVTNCFSLLRDLSGWVAAGEVVVIAGAPGCGKTTLLNALAWRKVAGRVSGQVLVNGYPRERESWIRATGYVEKAEVYPPYLTLYECLCYRAAMNLPRHVTSRQRGRLLEEILECTGLGAVRRCLVKQLVGSGPSEQEKRVAVAIELANNPSVLFLDAPLVGLDHGQGTRFVHNLEHMALTTRRAVVMTATMPTALQLDACTRILLLKRGGQQVYFGPPGLHGAAIMVSERPLLLPRRPRPRLPQVSGGGLGGCRRNTLRPSLARRPAFPTAPPSAT